MMKIFFRVLLSISSTVWMIVVYVIKTQLTFYGLSRIFCGLIYIAIGMLISVLALVTTRALDKDEIIKCTTFSLADNEFVSVYLGYFFVALSVPDKYTLFFVYVMVLALVFMTNAYFNPVFIIFGYHYYNVVTAEGSEMFLICKSVERNAKDVEITELRRINNRTYISHEGV